MEFDLNKQTLTIYGKTERLSVLANRLQALSGKQTYEFLSQRSVFLPRKINVLALRSVLNERIKTLHASELPKEYYAILENYRNFSEYQLFNLFATICDNKDDFKAYRLNLWKLILINYEALNLTDGEINYLKNISKLQTERLEKYFQYITSSAREMENTFDGLDKAALKIGLFASASEEDVIDIASKYGIDLPLEYDLDSFKAALKEYLAAYNKLTMELDSYIDKANDMTLENFAIKNKIPLSFKMDRDKLINYLFFILSIAEMNLTDVKEIIEPEAYKPLEFSVNLDGAFDGDTPIDSVRIIIYDGCENDGLFVPAEEEHEEAREYEEVTEEPEEEALEVQEEAIEEPEALAPQDEEVKEESSPLDVLKDDSLNDGQTNASLLARAKAGFAAQNRKERKELSFGDIEENPYYGNPKAKKLYTGPTKMIVLSIFLVLLVGLGVSLALKFAGII